MATVYSLICWGGRTGKVVTMTIASPCVVTSTNHGLRDGGRLVFETTGALPTGITAGVTYYAKSTEANTFNLYTDAALTSIVNTSGSQSGTHTAKSVLMGEYFTQYPGRWGSSGSERCYDGVASFVSTRSALASYFDKEVCEVGEKFTDRVSGLSFALGKAPSALLTSMVAGSRSEAYHFGTVGNGYWIGNASSSHIAMNAFSGIEGITVRPYDSSVNGTLLTLNEIMSSAANCIFLGWDITKSVGVTVYGTFSRLENCLSMGFLEGIVNNCQSHCVVCGNTSVKNGTGIKSYGNSTSYRYGHWRNNISVGNTTNWQVEPTSLQSATNNFGESGDTPWAIGSGTTGVMSTTDFSDFVNNDFMPASASSPQVDAAVDYYEIPLTDIAGNERPNYNNGGSEVVDVGCYEFDHGYGNRPASTTVTFSGVPSGTEIRVYDQSQNELAGVESSLANPSLAWVLTGADVRIVIINLDYVLQEFTYTPVSGSVTLPIQMDDGTWYSNP